MTTATLTREAPNHDTLTCYINYRCRLPECVARYNAHENERRRAQKAGTWNRLVDAEPVRQHIRTLQTAGIGLYTLSIAANVLPQTIYDLVRPQPSREIGHRYRVTRELAEKILAVTPDNVTAYYVDPTGTIRRAQTLVAAGWPQRVIERHAGLAAGYLTWLFRTRATITAPAAKAIADTYNTLRTMRPTRHGVSKGHAKAARARATANHWPTAKYWDQHPDLIDDPNFTPQLTRIEQVAEDARWLLSLGNNRNEVAERLGVSRDYIDRALNEVPAREETAA